MTTTFIGVSAQQNNAKVRCAITQVRASESKKFYLWDIIGYSPKDFNKQPIRELTGKCRHPSHKMALLEQMKRPSEVVFLKGSKYISLKLHGIYFKRKRNTGRASAL